MFQFTPGGVKFKIFVKESDTAELPEKLKTKRNYFTVTPLTGDKAKEFYEDILKESSLPKRKNCREKSKPREKKSPEKPVQNKTYKKNDLLRMAQNNDVEGLSIFFSQKTDYDVNIVDDFGWTPLMCASCSGAEEAVEMLLENGADPHISDRLGNTALKLARQKNKTKIVQRLENYKIKPEVSINGNAEELIEFFFCTACKENFTMNKMKHESSTLHLFNCHLKTTTFYGIPECNKGFQLLLREGWDKEKGLGPDGTGRKFPVKAVMKKDRLGIGASPTTDRNKREAQHTEKYESKKRKIHKRWKDKDFEKNFRLEFS